jgi:hypothetical protein
MVWSLGEGSSNQPKLLPACGVGCGRVRTLKGSLASYHPLWRYEISRYSQPPTTQSCNKCAAQLGTCRVCGWPFSTISWKRCSITARLDGFTARPYGVMFRVVASGRSGTNKSSACPKDLIPNANMLQHTPGRRTACRLRSSLPGSACC